MRAHLCYCYLPIALARQISILMKVCAHKKKCEEEEEKGTNGKNKDARMHL